MIFTTGMFLKGWLVVFLATAPAQESEKPLSPSPASPSGVPRFVGKRTGVEISEARPEDITPENYPNIIESFVFPNADLTDVIKTMNTDLNIKIIMGPEVANKKISIISYSPITVAEAFQGFLSALAVHGLTVVKSGSFLKVVTTDKALKSNAPVYTNDKKGVHSDHFVTHILKLKHIDAKTLEAKIKPLMDGTAVKSLIIYEPSNMVILSDHGLNVEKVKKIIKALDVPSQENIFKVLPIKHAEAKTLEGTISKLLAGMGASSYRSSSYRRGKSFKNLRNKVNITSLSSDERTNSLIVMGNAEGIKKVEDLVRQLDYYQDPELSGGIFVYKVKHGTAQNLAKTLNSLLKDSGGSRSPGSTRGGKKTVTHPSRLGGGGMQLKNVATARSFQDIQITPEKNTNSLLIVANKYNYENIILNLLKEVDISRNQVFVKATLLEMTVGRSSDWKIGTYFFPKGGGGLTRAGYGMSENMLSDLISTAGATLMFPLVLFKNFPGSLLSGSPELSDEKNQTDISQLLSIKAPSLTNNLNRLIPATNNEDDSKDQAPQSAKNKILFPSLSAFIQFLQSNMGANVLSNPQVIALDHEEATISIVERIPIIGSASKMLQQGGAGALQLNTTTKEQEVKVELKITPHINPDVHSVRLEIEQEFGNLISSERIPEELQKSAVGTKSRKLKTFINLRNQETAVLGGLATAENNIKEYKIPILGDLPLIGRLFKNSSTQKNKTNLVLFITPHIIRSASDDHRHILSDKLKERLKFIHQFTNKDPFAGLTSQMLQAPPAPVEGGKPDEPLPPLSEDDDEGEKLPSVVPPEEDNQQAPEDFENEIQGNPSPGEPNHYQAPPPSDQDELLPEEAGPDEGALSESPSSFEEPQDTNLFPP